MIYLLFAIIGFLWGAFSTYDLIKRYRKELGIREGLFDSLTSKQEDTVNLVQKEWKKLGDDLMKTFSPKQEDK